MEHVLNTMISNMEFNLTKPTIVQIEIKVTSVKIILNNYVQKAPKGNQSPASQANKTNTRNNLPISGNAKIVKFVVMENLPNSVLKGSWNKMEYAKNVQ